MAPLVGADVADLDDHVLRRRGAGEHDHSGSGERVEFELHANTSGLKWKLERTLARSARR